MMAMAGEPVLNLDDIQGNVVPGFKKDYQHMLFFRLGDVAKARPWLAQLSGRIWSARQTVLAHALWKAKRAQLDAEPDDLQLILIAVALTAQGLRKLVAAFDPAGFADEAFKNGLTAGKSGLLGDPTAAHDPGAAANWLVGGSNGRAVDLLVIAASDDRVWIEEATAKLIAGAKAADVALVHRDNGAVLAGAMAGHEPFGFKDGISQPSLRGVWPGTGEPVAMREWPADAQYDELRQDFASPGSPLVWPGHFLFGYPKCRDRAPREPAAGPIGPDWATNGSFVVYRRLRQDVAGFQALIAQQTGRLKAAHPGLDEEKLGALLVGRWKSGTPVERAPDRDIGLTGDPANYFRYAEQTTVALPGDAAPLNLADRDGARCPMSAHIRKVNPRDQETDIGPADQTLAKTLLRRGIPFDNSAQIEGDVGLIFIAYQSSIEEQFEFLTRNWINQPDRPRAGGGVDPLLAAGIRPNAAVTITIDGAAESVPLAKRLVVPTGGVYLFAPSLSAFRAMTAAP